MVYEGSNHADYVPEFVEDACDGSEMIVRMEATPLQAAEFQGHPLVRTDRQRLVTQGDPSCVGPMSRSSTERMLEA